MCVTNEYYLDGALCEIQLIALDRQLAIEFLRLHPQIIALEQQVAVLIEAVAGQRVGLSVDVLQSVTQVVGLALDELLLSVGLLGSLHQRLINFLGHSGVLSGVASVVTAAAFV